MENINCLKCKWEAKQTINSCVVIDADFGEKTSHYILYTVYGANTFVYNYNIYAYGYNYMYLYIVE